MPNEALYFIVIQYKLICPSDFAGDLKAAEKMARLVQVSHWTTWLQVELQMG